MTNIKIGNRYKLVRHPYNPIGRVIGIDSTLDFVTIEWEGNLIPSIEKYPFVAFHDGSFMRFDEQAFTYSGGDDDCYSHSWESYTGVTEAYDFCKRCNKKRFHT